MNRTPQSIQLNVRDQQELTVPAIVAAMAFSFLLVLYALTVESPRQELNLVMGFGGLAYTALNYYVFLPIFGQRKVMWWIITLINAGAVSILLIFEQLSLPGITFLFTIPIIVVSAILSGRWTTYAFTAILFTIQVSFNQPVFPWTPDRIFSYIVLPIIALIITETIVITQKNLARQFNHLEILNRISRSLASTIEIQDVITLVCDALQSAFNADTYYVGLLQDDSLSLELFYDDGEFYPKTVVPLENTLAGHVLRTRQSLLMTDLPKDRIRLNLPLFIIGSPKVSLSWMGIPMESGGEILGIMAVASYKRSAFSQSDLDLIKNIAGQAAMAIDNARHHEEVERRSRLDSLTGILNHSSFLKTLEEKTQEALANNTTLSVIMMDIDHFKQFNDDHGHLVGDQVLCLVTDTIRRNIKSTDIVGRWGGEEFVVALPNASGEDAVKIAQRLQKSMAQLYLASREKQVIPAPTISQGIAVFPDEANDVYPLVDLADQRLYRAKERGRNQIEPQEGFWSGALITTETTAPQA